MGRFLNARNPLYVIWRCALVCERLRCEPWRPWGWGETTRGPRARRPARAGGWGIETGHERVRDTHVASSVVDVLRVATDSHKNTTPFHSLVSEKKIPLALWPVRWSVLQSVRGFEVRHKNTTPDPRRTNTHTHTHTHKRQSEASAGYQEGECDDGLLV